ncbi:MAG: hypothetical protein EOO28_35490 [Comamonadaceae bacterium]|nr:MAG: hypothetical protein EOO28_35490 [Comamonadaceae bacterium]
MTSPEDFNVVDVDGAAVNSPNGLIRLPDGQGLYGGRGDRACPVHDVVLNVAMSLPCAIGSIQ